MKTIFLESHHLKNRCFGFGQFNYHLIQALAKQSPLDYKIVLHGRSPKNLKREFGSAFDYKKYYSLRRYENFRIRKKYDLWHSLNQNTRIEPYHNLPYLLTVHNITYIKDRENYMQHEVHQRFQEKLNRSDAITYISEYAKASTHKFFQLPSVPEYVIYNGNPIKKIDIPENFKPTVNPDKPFLFSIGEFTRRKNFKVLIKMLLHIPDYQLVIAGKDSTQYASQIRDLVSKMKLGDRVFLPGKISEVEKQYFYKNCQAFVFPSLREGFGLPVIEAMRFGKPVFASNNTSLPEIGGDLTYYWNHYDPEYMTEVFLRGMKDFFKNEEKNREDSIKWAKRFNWDKAAKQYTKVYKSLL